MSRADSLSSACLFRVLAGGLLATAAACAGCAGARGPVLEQPVGETHTTASSTGGARREGEDSASQDVHVIVGPEVRAACAMPESHDDAAADSTPFLVESGRLRPRGGDDVLKQVAACASAGKLGAGTLRLIGAADPRGTKDYAYQLGTYRAAAAKQHLVDLGVPAAKIAIDSRGNADARGNDEASWSRDRRVEVRLAGSGPPLLEEQR